MLRSQDMACDQTYHVNTGHIFYYDHVTCFVTIKYVLYSNVHVLTSEMRNDVSCECEKIKRSSKRSIDPAIK